VKKILLLVVLVMLFACIAGGCTKNTPIPPAPEASPTIQVQELQVQDFDAFIEDSYLQLLRRDPETVLEMGLAPVLGTPTDQLTDISDEYIRETQALEEEILNTLQGYDRSNLSVEQQLTYDIYSWYLTDRVRGHEFMYEDYPVNPTIFSVHLDLLQFFTDLRPLTNQEEAEEYITSLKAVKTKFEQLIEGLEHREENGVVLPRFLVDYILRDLQSIASSNATGTPYYQAFKTRLAGLTNIEPGVKESLLTAADEAVNTSVLPAYQSLVEYFQHLQDVATNDAGVWKSPDGEAYYAYMLAHHTSTDMTADQIHELGMQALDEIHAEMRLLFDQLGYPADESIPELYDRATTDSGVLSGEEIVRGYEELISAADQRMGEAFDLRPSASVMVMGVPQGGYYTFPALDGSRPGIFYATNQGFQPKFSMPTLAYHEAIPGHHFQIAIAQQLDLPSFLRASDFTAYVEGWALYAEQLVKELGFYENDPYGDLGRLQARAFRAARLVVDTGLHAKKWTFNQAVNFMVENTGMPEYMMQGEVSRYITLPGQATAYYIGYTKIMEARQQAMEALGDSYDLKEFHNLLLGSGALPLDILDQVVSSYIQSKSDGG